MTFKDHFYLASYRVFRFVSAVTNTVLGFQIEKVPKNVDNFMILFNETRVTNGYIPFLACPMFVHHIVMDYIKGRWYGGMIRAHLNTVFINQNAPLLAMREVTKRMKKGESFLLFPEGTYTTNGITGDISDSTGAFIKTLKRTLVTYRITGGYLRYPTWSVHSRKGPVKGSIVGIYTPEQIEKMTPQELTAQIRKDLYVNAYEDQKRDMIEYPGKALAEGIETFLSICPKCGSFHTIRSKGDYFGCTACGLKGSVDRYGFIRSKDFSFTTIPELEKEELRLFDEHYHAVPDEDQLLSFDHVVLEKLNEKFRPESSKTASLSVYKDRMEIGGMTFVFEELREVRTLRGLKKGCPMISVRTENERYMLSGGNLCPWQVRRTFDISLGHPSDRF